MAKRNVIGKAKVDGRWVEVEVYDPVEEGGGSFLSNPQTQQALLSMLNVGLGAYKATMKGVEFIPNAAGSRLKRSLPWAAIAAAGFYAASAAGGVLRIPIQVLGGAAGVKALIELLRK